jgi:hypothetical protein
MRVRNAAALRRAAGYVGEIAVGVPERKPALAQIVYS